MIKFTQTMVILPITLIIIGVFIVAERSIPGNTLYPLKTKVAEPVAGFFSLSKEEKLEWQERLIERRLKETEKLITIDKLDDKTRLEIENSLEQNINKFSLNTKNLINKNGIDEEITDINLRLEAALGAYKIIIASLSSNPDINDSIKTESTILLSKIESYEENTKNVRENLANKITPEDDNTILATQETHRITEDLLNSTKLLYQKNKVKFTQNVQNDINNKLAGAEKFFEEGNIFVLNQDYINAIDKYNLSTNQLSEAKLLILTNLITENIQPKTPIDDDEFFDEDINKHYDNEDEYEDEYEEEDEFDD